MESLKENPVKERFRSTQDAYFERAEIEKYRWQTGHPFFSSTEKALLPEIPVSVQSLLEIGCGEGGNLKLMERRPRLTVGIDLYPEKAAFAQSEMPSAKFLTADGFHLPFMENAFDFIFIRDVLHHVENPETLLREAWRVLKSGGYLAVMEPNGRNPLAWFFSAIVPAERLATKNSPEKLTRWLAAAAGESPLEIQTLQPFPLFRAVFHYRYGWPWLSNLPGMNRLFTGISRTAGRILPKSRWFYMQGVVLKK